MILVAGAGATAAVAWWWGAWAVVPAFCALALLSFYRDPPRTIPVGDDLLLAPADGRLIRIERPWRAPDGDRDELRFVIFLSVLDAHVNRTACAGRVEAVHYRRGTFLNALRVEATERNESNLVIIDPRPPLPGPVCVRQIAGVLARRVVCMLKPGQEVVAGQRFGMIKLGSQTELRVPDDPRWEVVVRRGERVKAGRTVLARFRAP